MPINAPPGETRVQFVMRRVVEHIARERLRVGDDLPSETRFVEVLGVSRPVVREAFGALAALNIVETANGRRPRVSALNGSVLSISLDHAVRTEQISVRQVWETRRCLETETVALAAERRTDAEAAHIRELAEAMTRAGHNSPELMALDIRMHKAIAEAGRNLLMAQIIASLEPLLQSSVSAAWGLADDAGRHRDILDRHLEIAEAITNGDPAAARAAMDRHFDAAIAARLLIEDPLPA
ncbi:FadR/GntR family transcriptional regulator [Brevundimonas goettingensis]|uniref:FadR family transcriptional regulator n=1 Tax=Brevundimonas goettingensis TaxID=2774190 RepID=A0A975BYP1_9CAUL|nr:FadR/GntR family transcriptional regulator [Brevundimonas goettingensis]QTC90073.1 FadR family transcriptional regulator [Brevundimonas goettingensis]